MELPVWCWKVLLAVVNCIAVLTYPLRCLLWACSGGNDRDKPGLMF